ncbi:MAG: serine/threonine protein kinase, partial [Planctomycetes bacterium]|nr:serine/threonine protein kinase [Planctomycetota bacterium]
MTISPTHAAQSDPGDRGDPRPGEWIGHYQVVAELGRGGMGLVLQVRHGETGHEAALKLILAGAASEEASVRFGREAEVLARVQHRNVVRVFELGHAPQGPYLVTELVEGQALYQRLNEGPLDADEAIRLVIELSHAVQAVHSAGVLHRDLKPQNVILRPDGTPALLDFGIAHDESAEQLTRTGQLLGTPLYMSPEQASGDHRAVDARSDVYGLAAILFALLNGCPPYHELEGRGQYAVILAVLRGDPAWPRKRELPRELVAIVSKVLGTVRADRPASPGDFAKILETYLAEGSRARSRRPLLVLGAVAL